MMIAKHLVRLYNYMLFHGVVEFDYLHTRDMTICARVGFPKCGDPIFDDMQQIEWDIVELPNIDDALEIVNFAVDHSLANTDKIIISPSELQKKMGWNPSRFNPALDTLLAIEVPMVDDGERTDSFFIHF